MSERRKIAPRDSRRHIDSASNRKPEAPEKETASSGSWIPLVIGIVLVWPWLAAITCGITGVCLSPGSHHKDGWLSAHKIESSGWRLMFGGMAIGGGINGMVVNRRR
jgi:hypothetical protein